MTTTGHLLLARLHERNDVTTPALRETTISLGPPTRLEELVDELAVGIKAGGWRNPRGRDANARQLAGQIAARLPRHPETFQRLAPNTFGLTVWGDSPPPNERLKPRLGTMGHDPGYRGPWALELTEHPESWYDEMVPD